MKYSYHWLKELSGTKKSAERVAELLMRHAFEVESVEEYPHKLDGVRIGEVLSVEPHPNADRLRVARVFLGKKDERMIVCGAPNIAPAQKVAVILPGSRLPDGTEIHEAEIRGVKSFGMICSERELGIGDGHEGILVLPGETPVGAELAKVIGLNDTILDVKILPDRGSDALAYQGLAREIAALDGHAPQFTERKAKSLKLSSYNRAPKVSIMEKKHCARYVGLLFQDVELGPSPLSLRKKLLVSGLRPVNNVVDSTNILMLLTGQPVHAFDADKISGGITIRCAKKGEKLELLTGEKITLSSSDLVIADEKRVLALAGIMGGKYAAITEHTKNIFVEIASFQSTTIRRSKMEHRLMTDAAYRFERNVDTNLPDMVAREAAELMRELAQGRLTGYRDVYPEPRKQRTITLSLGRVDAVLGVKVPLFEAVQYLALLGLSVKKTGGADAVSVTVPTRRPDLSDEWDLIEEIGRMRGYDKIPAVAPTLPLLALPPNEHYHFERNAKAALVSLGMDEVMTYSFYGSKEVTRFSLPLSAHLELEDSVASREVLLRVSLLPNLVRKAEENLRYFKECALFEWGSVYMKKREGVAEEKRIALLVAREGKRESASAFFDLKGVVEAWMDALHLPPRRYDRCESVPGWAHPVRTADISCGGIALGSIGEVVSSARTGGKSSVFAIVELSLGALLSLSSRENVFEELPKYPAAVRDISLLFPQRVEVASVLSVITLSGKPLLRSVELFDMFERDNGRNLAFHLSFSDPNRTLSLEEVDRCFENIVLSVKEKLDGSLHA